MRKKFYIGEHTLVSGSDCNAITRLCHRVDGQMAVGLTIRLYITTVRLQRDTENILPNILVD